MSSNLKWALGILAFVVLLFSPLQWFGYGIYVALVYWVLWVPVIVAMFLFIPVMTDSDIGFLSVRASKALGILVFLFQVLIWIFFSTFQSMSLANVTHYSVQDSSALPVMRETRDQPYTVAKTLMDNQNSESQVGPSDLDYMIANDEWVSSLDPVDFTTKFWGTNTLGYVVLGPQGLQKIDAPRPYGEGAFLFAGDEWFIRTHGGYWNEWDEILSIRAGEEELAVVTLIDRNGIWAYPSVEKVLVIHQNGYVESLTVNDANNDPRLVNVQIMPTSYIEKIVEAYSCKSGLLSCISRKQKIKLQESTTNDENKAPFHNNTEMGSYWVAPFGPYSKPSLTGVALVKSDKITNTVFVYANQDSDVYPGVDSLAAYIENDIAFEGFVWYREATSTSSDATVTSGCGNKIILELVPTFRKDPDGVVRQYYLGYVSSAPVSNQVLWYVIVDPTVKQPEGRITVYQPLQTVSQVESWQRGEFELSVSTTPVLSVSAQSEAQNVTSTESCPIEQMDDETLAEMLRRIAETISK